MNLPAWVDRRGWVVWNDAPGTLFQPGRVVRDVHGDFFLMPTLPDQQEIGRYPVTQCRPANLADLPRCQRLIVGGKAIEFEWRPGLALLSRGGQVRRVQLPDGLPPQQRSGTTNVNEAARAIAHAFNGEVVPADEIDPRFLEAPP